MCGKLFLKSGAYRFYGYFKGANGKAVISRSPAHKVGHIQRTLRL